jgi:uncharacterized DUF497 family protein
MKLAGDAEAARWLSGLAGASEDFEWDAGNRTKHRKDGVEAEEVEQLLRHPYLLGGRIVEPAHAETRWLILGRSDAGRLLALVATRRGDRLRAISCRPMRRKEKHHHEQAVGSEEDPRSSGT